MSPIFVGVKMEVNFSNLNKIDIKLLILLYWIKIYIIWSISDLLLGHCDRKCGNVNTMVKDQIY